MKPLALCALLLAIPLSACGDFAYDKEPMPGKVSSDRKQRDTQTCKQLEQTSTRDKGFVFEIAQDCKTALTQILDADTDLATFDVARAYLDGLDTYAQTLKSISDPEQNTIPYSDFGSYLIGQKTGLIEVMQDWRKENGLRPHPELYTPAGQTMTNAVTTLVTLTA